MDGRTATIETEPRVGIVGGGPGGLLTAYHLEHVCHVPARVEILEASNRIGGKIRTGHFDGRAAYEAGTAELYDYSAVGSDPLKELVDRLGLTTHALNGNAVVVDGRLVASSADLARIYGPAAAAEYANFVGRARAAISPRDYYESDWRQDNRDPLSTETFDQLLATIADRRVRHYVEASIHSDLATESRHTSAAYGLANFLMNEPGYMRLYGIDGGLSRLIDGVADTLSAAVRLGCRVDTVSARDDGRLAVSGPGFAGSYDYLVIALPNYYLPSIDWRGPGLADAMAAHHAHYDRPAHYLRATVRFDRPFWREAIAGNYFMLDAFGGCCVYDESSRFPGGGDFVLSWLLGGSAALTISNSSDDEIIDRVVTSLPETLTAGRGRVLGGRVDRWVGSVNAMPGGFPLKDPDARHVPAPDGHPNLFVVGDYLFDSTLNGVMDSADCAAGWIAEDAFDDDEAVAPSAVGTDAGTV